MVCSARGALASTRQADICRSSLREAHGGQLTHRCPAGAFIVPGRHASVVVFAQGRRVVRIERFDREGVALGGGALKGDVVAETLEL